MNIEEFDDDFEPVKDDFVIDDTQSDEDALEENLKTDNPVEEADEQEIEEETKPTNAKKRRFAIISLSSILVILVFLFLFNTNYFQNYKTNFVMNLYALDARYGFTDAWSKVFGSKTGDLVKKKELSRAMGTTFDNDSFILPFESASDAQYSVADGKVIAAKSNYVAQISAGGKEVWKETTEVVNPILATEGDYIMIAENGGTKVYLYSNGKLLFAKDAENEILNANVSSSGDVVVVTKKDFFKGAVEVFNKKGERVFSWASGTYSIMCADISPSGRKIAVGFLDEKQEIKGIIQLFNIDEEESYKTFEIPGTAVFKLEFVGETLNVFGNNRFVGLSVHGSVIWDELADGVACAFDMDSKGNKVIVFDADNLPVIKRYSQKGRLRDHDSTDELPDYIDISGSTVLYNNTRMIYFGKLGREQKYAASMDVKGLRIIDNKNYMIIYNNSLEFVKK